MKKVKDILPSIFYLLLFTSVLGLIVYSILNIDTIKSSNTFKKVFGEKVSKTYELEKGVNFIGVDFNSKFKASRILKENENLTLIADYDDNEWENIVKSSSKRATEGKDFRLKEYRGYLIIASEDTTISLDGRKFNDISKLKLDKGLNLIGGIEYLSSDTIISEFKNSGIDVLGVTTWNNSTSMFLSNIIENGEIYGDILKIEENDGVFINIQ